MRTTAAFQIAMFAWLAVGKLSIIVTLTAICRMPFARRRQYARDQIVRQDQRAREWKGALFTASDTVLLGCAIELKIITLSTDSVSSIVSTVIAMLLWVDFWMYFVHRWMHNSRWLWKAHRHHHLSRVVQPSTALSFSATEKIVFYSAGWIGGACALSLFVPISLGGLVAYYTIYFVLSGLGHCNIVFFKERWIIPSPAVHALHHLNPSVNYGFYTTMYDRLFGTYRSPGQVYNTGLPDSSDRGPVGHNVNLRAG